MAYLMAVVVIVAVAGIAALVIVRLKGDRPTAADSGRRQITGRDVVPEAHPDEPVPGSATRRHQEGKP